MAADRRTFRISDGQRIPGAWRPVFVHVAGVHHLTELTVYADGLVDCHGLLTVDELAERLGYGWIGASLADGARAIAPGLASWRFAAAHTSLTAAGLLAEVRAEIERLNAEPPGPQAEPFERAVVVDRFSLPELHNDHPAPLTLDGVRYPSAAAALSAVDGPEGGPARPAVMARVLRAKFAQRSEAAAVLLATGDAVIRYVDEESSYWGGEGPAARKWAGRLLELVRAELAEGVAGR
ncbi:NADAR family protein [Kitasatospora sp. NPDC048540]|uniref:NADAR family protein n=1 Tax=Kitasatospora sp. NPDC048540 TaxID=3155634 RepID=UPI00340C53CD